MKAKEFATLSDAEAIMLAAPLMEKSHNETGILVSVMLAQFIYESEYGKSKLAQQSNNVFGIKTIVSGNTWENSAWDGKSVCSIMTPEMNKEREVVWLRQEFRAYDSVEESVRDHGMYLLHARNGKRLRYEGIDSAEDPGQVANILLRGGYSSFDCYAEKLIKIIKVWNLQRFDRRV